MKYLYIVLFFCLCFHPLKASSEAEYRKLSVSYSLQEDGSQEYRYSMELTLFTHTAMNSTYGESFIVYDPRYQQLVIHSAYTQQKDGTIIQTPENAFVEVLPRQAANALAFSDLREMVVVHTGLELGATIYLDYSILSKPGFYPALDIYEEILKSSPVKNYTITLSVPENYPLTYTLGGGIQAQEYGLVADGRKTVQWILENLPAASRTPDVSAANGDVPFLTATSYASRTEALDILAKQMNTAPDLQYLTFAEALTEGMESDAGKMFAILDYVNNQLGISAVSLRETGFRLRSLPQVTASAYGIEAEKIYMLACLLNQLGIEAEPGALFRVNVKDCSAGLSAIREMFVRAKVEGKEHYLSAHNNRISNVLFNKDYLPVMSLLRVGEEMNLPECSAGINYNAVLNISSTKVQGEAIVNLGTAFRTYSSHSTSGPDTTKVELSMTQLPGYGMFSLPDVPQSLSHSRYVLYNSVRDQHLRLDYLPHESYSYTLQLPENMEPASAKQNKELKNRVGELRLQIQPEGNQLLVKRELQLYTQDITPELYPEFRELMTEWGAENSSSLLFKIL